jgi:hypothetical protein
MMFRRIFATSVFAAAMLSFAANFRPLDEIGIEYFSIAGVAPE